MAEAATLIRTEQAFDFEAAERQLVEPFDFEVAEEQFDDEYARSNSALRAWGSRVILSRTVACERLTGSEAISYDNYTSGLREMITTDPEYGDYLDIDDVRQHDIVGGKVRDAEGKSMVVSIAHGRKASELAAKENPELNAQVIRDNGDVLNAECVDDMAVGQTRFALSMDPQHELKQYSKTYKGLGYREGMALIQWYSKPSEGELEAGVLSVDLSDMQTWRALFAKHKVELPGDVTPNTFIRHGFERDFTPEQAQTFVLEMRDEYYKMRGVTEKRYSSSQYLAQHKQTIDSYFQTYYPSLAHAIYSGENNETLQALAQSMLQADLSKMKADRVKHLRRVAEGGAFDDELGRTMDEVIRYSVVEHLRVGLKQFIGGEKSAPSVVESELFLAENMSSLDPVQRAHLQNQQLARGLSRGVKDGRSYGGCSSVDLSNEAQENQLSDVINGPQSSFGGRGKKDRIPKTINCIKCKMPSPREQVVREKTWCCPKCNYEIDVCDGSVKNESTVDKVKKIAKTTKNIGKSLLEKLAGKPATEAPKDQH